MSIITKKNRPYSGRMPVFMIVARRYAQQGFTAVPGGTRGYIGLFAVPSGQYMKIGKYGYWWSSTDVGSSSPHVWFRTLGYSNSNINSAGNNGWNNDKCGFSLRCVKD